MYDLNLNKFRLLATADDNNNIIGSINELLCNAQRGAVIKVDT